MLEPMALFAMPSAKLQIKTFLSHKYKSAEANLYFWSILSEVAGFQFEIDEGTKRTSVTRLELMIRECDAVIGIFTLPADDPDKAVDEIAESAYFRLETDLAIRSGKPTLLYVDKRYAALFPQECVGYVQRFDAREIESGSKSPSHDRFRDICRRFCREVHVYKQRERSRLRELDPSKVGIVVSANSPDSAYSDKVIDAIAGVLEQHGIRSPSVMRFPDSRAAFQLSGLDTVGWLVADVGPELFRTGLIGYLHGRFVPMMRLLNGSGAASNTIGDHRCLHAGIEKGYDSDLVRWTDVDDLVTGIGERLSVIRWPRRLITTPGDAHGYFAKAARRKEFVFLSYSGEDQVIAAEIRDALKQRFQDVFDYRDGKSIRPGQPWLDEIDRALHRGTVAVQLLSQQYMGSAHCQQEARIMNNLNINKKLQLMPVKLKDEKLDAPSWQSDKQYIHLYRLSNIKAMVDQIVDLLDKAA